MASISLYNYFRSSTSYRVRIALHYKNIAFEYLPINLLKGEQHSSSYRMINPLGGVPALVHNGKVIPESFAILEYLDEVFPEPHLLPKDPYTRARIRQFCEIINSFMHPMGNLKTLQYLEKKHGYDQTEKDHWVQHWANQGLTAIEQSLKEFSGTFCFGDKPSMADLFLVPQVLTCQRFKVDLANFPLVVRVNENCLNIAAFQKANPFIQVDTPEDLRRPT
jgi:maleylacetoacetate isomerase